MDHNLLDNNSPSKMVQKQTKTMIGLGLGMGIQMGPDGRFYASMGGQTMPTGPSDLQMPNY